LRNRFATRDESFSEFSSGKGSASELIGVSLRAELRALLAATEAVVGHVYDRKQADCKFVRTPALGTIDAVVVFLTTDCTPARTFCKPFSSMAVTGPLNLVTMITWFVSVSPNIYKSIGEFTPEL